MGFYRKLPVVIEARQLTESNIQEVAEWCDGYAFWNTATNDVGLEIETLEGTHCANLGDYIIKGSKGEFYPCKPDIFYNVYERVTDVS